MNSPKRLTIRYAYELLRHEFNTPILLFCQESSAKRKKFFQPFIRRSSSSLVTAPVRLIYPFSNTDILTPHKKPANPVI